MTTNIQPFEEPENSHKSKAIGFLAENDGKAQESEEGSSQVHDALLQFFRPEFLNRMDEIIRFRHLDKNDVRKILWMYLKDCIDGLREKHGVSLEIEPEVENFLLMKGYDHKNGAREMKRTVERFLVGPLSKLLNIKGNLKKSNHWQAVLQGNNTAIIPNL